MKTFLSPQFSYLSKTNMFPSTSALDSSIKKSITNFSIISIRFALKYKAISEWEHVFISGSHSKLGNWNVDEAIEMTKDIKNPELFLVSIQLNHNECRNLLYFRYFIGYYLQKNVGAKKKLIISKWESQRCARCVLPSVEEINGICRKKHEDEFGVYGNQNIITNGWLNQPEQQTVLLKFYGDALKFYKARHAHRFYFIKVTPFDVRHREDFNFAKAKGPIAWRLSSLYISSIGSNDDESLDDFLPLFPSFSTTQVANISNDSKKFCDQMLYGTLFQNNKDFLKFKTQSLSVENLAFRIELFSNSNLNIENLNVLKNINVELQQEKLNLERLAIVYCMPANLSGTNGTAYLPILTKNQQPIGQLKADYSFVTALKSLQTMEVSYARHWKKRQTINVGHRGMGDSYTKFSTVRENTVHSMEEALKHGADFVEFDVQLTKDKFAVIFHDFHVLVSVAKRKDYLSNLMPSINYNESNTLNVDSNSNEKSSNPLRSQAIVKDNYHKMAVKDLNLNQLRFLHVYHCTALEEVYRDKLQVTPSDPHEIPSHCPFPTLIEALKHVDLDLGFNIEIKYPMVLADDSNECDNYFEPNEFVDVILNDILKYGGTRRIILSSFDPDICIYASLKQKKYPVLFLSLGKTNRYMQYKDLRSSSSHLGCNLAMCFNFLGINFHSEELLVDSSYVAYAHEKGLISFVWGEDLENKKNIDYFRKKLLVDGIVHDKIGVYENRQNIFVVEREKKNVLFYGKLTITPSISRIASFDELINKSIIVNSDNLKEKKTR